MTKLMPEALASLSKEEKLRLYDLLQEKKRRQLMAKPKFVPHPGQARVIRSKALERYLFCGNGYGKSALLCNSLHWTATGFNPITGEHTAVPAKICLVLDTPEKIDELITEYRKWYPLDEKQLHKRGKAYYSQITYDNGSSVTVLTHEVSDLKPEGSQWTDIICDEPPPQWLFTAIFRGGRIKGRPARVLMAGTPVKAAWLRTEVYEPWVEGETPWVECFTGDSEENASNLEDGWLERFGAKLSEKEKLIRLKGQFFDIEGLALAHLFKPQEHIVPEDNEHRWDSSWPCVVVFDPAPSKAHVAVLVGVDASDKITVLEEYKEKTNGRQFCKNVIGLNWFTRYRVVDIIYDSLGNSENLMGESYKPFGTILNEELRIAQIGRARATTYDEKDDEDFIERIREALVVKEDGPKLRFRACCRGSIDDVKTVQWYEDKQIKENKTKLDLRKKDFLACIKYALATNLFFDKPRRSAPHYVKKDVYGLQLPAARSARMGVRGAPRRSFFSGGYKAKGRPVHDDEDW